MELEVWRTKYQKMREIAERTVSMRRERIRQLTTEAGLDGSMFPLFLHNALVSFERGQPWRGVDYKKVKLAHYLEQTMWEPYHIIDRWDRRVRQ